MIWLGRLTAALVTLLLLPLHLLLLSLVLLVAGRPVFYLASRLGRRGTPFTMLKYRTMKVGAAPAVSPDLKLLVARRDPRLIPLGRVLRLGFDELPQLWNIVRGEMSWVGPRPDEPWVLPTYGPCISERLDTVPGLTGLSQVCDSRALTSPEGYATDVWYVRHRSPALDLLVIALTPAYVVGFRSPSALILRHLRRSPEFQALLRTCATEFQRHKSPEEVRCSSATV